MPMVLAMDAVRADVKKRVVIPGAGSGCGGFVMTRLHL